MRRNGGACQLLTSAVPTELFQAFVTAEGIRGCHPHFGASGVRRHFHVLIYLNFLWAVWPPCVPALFQRLGGRFAFFFFSGPCLSLFLYPLPL